jgi:hypothetical protein
MQNPPGWQPQQPFYPPNQSPLYPPQQSSNPYAPPPPGQGGWPQAPQHPLPSGQRPNWQPGPPPRKRSRKKLWVVVVAIFLILIIIGAINSGSKGNNQAAAAPTQAAQATTAITPTSNPTPKPQKGPSRAQLDALIAPVYPPITIESYKQSTGALVVSVSYGEGVNWNQSVTKKAMADTQATFWEQQNWYFSSITVNVYELLFAGGQRKMAYGVLTYQTAQAVNFGWGLYGDLWEKYDQKWMDARVPSE